jgi:hypothetical protein
MSDATRYPLCWPAGRPRTADHRRARAKFHSQRREQSPYGGPLIRREGVSLATARDDLLAELTRLGARNVVLSTNLKLRTDGLPLAGQRQPDDPGVAVYFRYNDRPVCFACDRWNRVEDNLVAVAKTIEALRGIDRWGTGDMVEAAFTGFAQLPAARVALRPWYSVIGVSNQTATADVEAAYRLKAKELHPDRGGDHDAMVELNDAYERFKRERGL